MMKILVGLARRPRLVGALALSVLIAGALSLRFVAVSLYPTVTRPKITVSCTYPGANAREVMNTVAGPLEEQVNGVEGMDTMTSSCTDTGSYSLTVNFQVGFSRDMALMKVQSKVQQALSQLPQEVKNTGVTVESGFPEELGTLTLRSKNGKLTRQEVVDYAYGVVNPAILRVAGIGKSYIQDNKIAMRVWLDAKRMASLGIDTAEVVSAIKAQNVQASLGTVGASPSGAEDCKVIALISKGRLDSEAEFEKIVVRTEANGGLVRLGEIARIEKGQQGYTYSALYDETPAVYITLYQMQGVNVLATMEAVKDQLRALEPSFPGDMVWDMTNDSTRYMKAALSGIGWMILLAAILSVLAVLIITRSWKVAALVLALLPVPLCATFSVMLAGGYFVNTLTLYALIVSVMLIAALASVMVMKIREDGVEKAIDCLGKNVLATSLIVAVSMVPLMMVDGVPGVLYRQFAVVVGIAAVVAGINTLLIVPAFAALVFKKGGDESKHSVFSIGLNIPAALGQKVLGLLVVAIAMAAIVIAQKMPREFIPNEDRGYLILDCKTAEGRSMLLTSELMKRVYDKLRKIDGIEKTVTLLGSSSIFNSTENNAKMEIILKDWSERSQSSEEIARKILASVGDLPDSDIYILRPPPVAGFGSANGITVLLQSMVNNDPVQFANEAQKLLAVFKRSPLANYASCGTMADSPHLRVTVDREKCELMKVPMSTLYTAMQHHLGSVYVNDVNLGTQVNRVTVMSDWEGRATASGIGDLYVRSSTGDMVPIKALASFKEELGVSACYRYNQYLYCTLQFVPKPGVSESAAIEEVKRLSAANLPSGYIQGWSGFTYEQFRTRGDTPILILLAFVAAYLVMVAFTESIVRPIRLLLPSVVVVAGAVFLLYVTGVAMSFYSQVAMILMGIIVGAMNLLVMNLPPCSRIRILLPFLMTLSVIPLIFAFGPGSSGSHSFGVAMLGGFVAYFLVSLMPSLHVVECEA